MDSKILYICVEQGRRQAAFKARRSSYIIGKTFMKNMSLVGLLLYAICVVPIAFGDTVFFRGVLFFSIFVFRKIVRFSLGSQ